VRLRLRDRLLARPGLEAWSTSSYGNPTVAAPCATMYIHRMIRTQLYLDAAMHRRLQELARKQGRTVSDLVRDAVARAYGGHAVEEQLRTLRAIAGLWRDRKDLGATREYVRRLRRDTRHLRWSKE
jgi:predicted transcriptional regulator